VYLVLEGEFELVRGGRRLAVLGKGEVLGEIGFLGARGQRALSIRARSDARLLVLRRRFLEELARADPDAALRVLGNLAGILAAGVAGLLQERAQPPPPAPGPGQRGRPSRGIVTTTRACPRASPPIPTRRWSTSCASTRRARPRRPRSCSREPA